VIKNICIELVIIIFIISGFFNQLLGQESPSIGNLKVFPADNPWNWDITNYSVHPNSNNYIESIGRMTPLHPDFGSPWQGVPIGIPYIVVSNGEPMIPITYTAFGDESDPGPFPIPLNAPIEGGSESGGDRHVIAVDTNNAMLYELYFAYPKEDRWEAASGAKFDLSSNELRPEGYTSADAAGLPIFPGLVRYEEVYIHKQINHALRFTVVNTRREYIWPARHYASQSDNPNFPPMGLRFRLKPEIDITDFSEPIKVILRAMKKYGIIVADNGSNWFISGAPDDRWDNTVLSELKSIIGSDFEAIVTVGENGDPIYPTPSNISHRIPILRDYKIINYPNPFNPSTKIKFDLPKPETVKIEVYNIIGQKIQTLLNNPMPAGYHEVEFNGQNLSSGIYLYRIEAGEWQDVKKMVYLK